MKLGVSFRLHNTPVMVRFFGWGRAIGLVIECLMILSGFLFFFYATMRTISLIDGFIRVFLLRGSF